MSLHAVSCHSMLCWPQQNLFWVLLTGARFVLLIGSSTFAGERFVLLIGSSTFAACCAYTELLLLSN